MVNKERLLQVYAILQILDKILENSMPHAFFFEYKDTVSM